MNRSFWVDDDLILKLDEALNVDESRSEFVRAAIRAEIDRRKKSPSVDDRLLKFDERLRKAGI